jgi:LPS sulfotransferase NodH
MPHPFIVGPRVRDAITRSGTFVRVAAMSAAKPIAFVVFTSPRTGSSWLIDLLDSHPQIAAYAELFLPGDRSTPDYGSLDLPRFETTLEARRRITRIPSRLAYLRRVFARRDGVGAAGFKLMYGHPEVHSGLLPYLGARRARVVHLVRENALEQVVSWETSVARGQFRAHSGEHVAELTVRVDTATLPERLAGSQLRVERARKTLRRYRLPSLEVTYERLRQEPARELGKITDLLGVEPRAWTPSSSLIVMNAQPWRSTVENAAEVDRTLAGTTFAWMLG